jgi:Rrf2 family protein
MLTRTATHALGVLRRLAREPETRMPAEALARDTGIPANYLSKILNQLRKRQIVEGEKGWGGGFRLRPEALDRPILDIVEIFEGLDSVTGQNCIFGLAPCNEANPCALHPFVERFRAVRDEMLTTIKVRDLLVPLDDPRREAPTEERA